jgi:hypothetical protein
MDTPSAVGDFINLSDMSSITVSLSRNRWYFHHEGSSQFGGTSETLGYCDAAFSVSTGGGSVNEVARFEWGAIPPIQVAGQPFPVTITAKDTHNRLVPGFTRSVSFSGSGLGPVDSFTLRESPMHEITQNNGTFTLGYAFTPATDLAVTHVRHYAGPKVSGWTDTGQLVFSRAVSGTSGQWTETALPAPVLLAANSRYPNRLLQRRRTVSLARRRNRCL